MGGQLACRGRAASCGVGGPPGPCWADALLAAGACVTMLDVRGHGGSAAARAPRTCEELAGDVTRLLDHLELAAADLVGYSMGALIAARLLGREARLRSVVLAGAGAHFLHGPAACCCPPLPPVSSTVTGRRCPRS